MMNCPLCHGELALRGEEYVCLNEACGFRGAFKQKPTAQWLLDIAENEAYWQERYFDELPTFIAHEYYRLRLMALYPNVFCMVYQIKDVGEVLLKLPVLCAAAYLKEVCGDESFGAMLIGKPLGIGDWVGLCSALNKNVNQEYKYPLPDWLRHILKKASSLSDLAKGRNDYLGHGAMGFDDNEGYRQFSRDMMERVSRYLNAVFQDYQKLRIRVGEKTLRGRVYPPDISPDAQPVLLAEDREIPLAPFIVHTREGGVLFFDKYRSCQSDSNALGLNYIWGGGRVPFAAPYLTELYNRTYGNLLNAQAASADMPVDRGAIHQQVEELLNQLNAADNFIRPDYLIDWIDEWHEDAQGAVNLLTMDRGMGKTSLSYAMAEGKISELSDTFVAAYYCGGSQMQRDYLQGIHQALARGLVEKKAGEFPRLKPDAPDKRANLLECLTYFKAEQSFWNPAKPKLLLIIDGLDELPVECAGLFDYLPDPEELPEDTYLLLTSRNPENEPLPRHVRDRLASVKVSHRMTVNANAAEDDKNSEQNRALLKTYLQTKVILPTGKEPTDAEADQLIALSGSTFLNLKLYAKLAESGVPVSDLPPLDKKPLFERYLAEIRKYYGEKLFGEAMTMLYAIVTAKEPLTSQEIAWLCGEEHITLKQIAFLRDFGALLKSVRVHTGSKEGEAAEHSETRGSLVCAANESYAGYMEGMFPQKKQEQAVLFTDRLLHTDTEQYRDAEGHYRLPDGLLYMAAYLPDVTRDISEEIRDRVYNDIDDCVINSMEPHILTRRAKMGEEWQRLCGEKGWFERQLGFMNIAGNSYSTMCDYQSALAVQNERVTLCEQYLADGRIDDRNDLAGACMNRAVTYDSMGEYEKALSDYDRCIDIREDLLEQGKLETLNDLASACMNRAVTYNRMGEYEKALSDYNRGIAIMEDLLRQGKLYDWQYDLGLAWCNKGELLADGFHDKDGALAIVDHAISLLAAEDKLSFGARSVLSDLRSLRDRITNGTSE